MRAGREAAERCAVGVAIEEEGNFFRGGDDGEVMPCRGGDGGGGGGTVDAPEIGDLDEGYAAIQADDERARIHRGG